eukprot:1160193-Pelagomonas_calceolata.AAC.11
MMLVKKRHKSHLEASKQQHHKLGCHLSGASAQVTLHELCFWLLPMLAVSSLGFRAIGCH